MIGLYHAAVSVGGAEIQRRSSVSVISPTHMMAQWKIFHWAGCYTELECDTLSLLPPANAK